MLKSCSNITGSLPAMTVNLLCRAMPVHSARCTKGLLINTCCCVMIMKLGCTVCTHSKPLLILFPHGEEVFSELTYLSSGLYPRPWPVPILASSPVFIFLFFFFFFLYLTSSSTSEHITRLFQVRNYVQLTKQKLLVLRADHSRSSMSCLYLYCLFFSSN